MKKVIVLFLLYFTTYLSGCFTCSNKDGSTTYITIHSAKGLFYSFDKNGIFPYLEKFNRDELGITISSDSTSERIEFSLLPSFINSAYACSDPYEVYFENRIDSVSIFTIYDFDENHLAGSKINELLNPLDNMGETKTGVDIAGLEFITQHFKFFKSPKYDTLQFLIVGRISGEKLFQTETEIVIL